MSESPEVAKLRAELLFALCLMWRGCEVDQSLEGKLGFVIGTLCPTCLEGLGGMAPTHDGSSMCESGSIASGGTKAHCTCDRCF